MRTPFRPPVVALALALLLAAPILPVPPSIAYQSATEPDRDTPPVFDERSGSWFQLIWSGHAYRGITWEDSRIRAERRTLNGVRGRLAVVTDPLVHQFLMQRLRPDQPVWIGLRYWCRYKSLQWVSGDLLDRRGFTAWHPQWFRDPNIRCDTAGNARAGEYMPVYYSGVGDGFLWQATAREKLFLGYIVEYPAARRPQARAAQGARTGGER